MKEKTNAQVAFDETIKAVYDLLKPVGFKKKALNFYRIKNDVCQLINIQKSLYNSNESITFTINIGVDIAKTDNNFPPMTHFHIRERIGNIKKKEDFWYAFDEIQDIFTRKQKYQSERQLVLEDIEKYALPFLDKFTNQNDIEHFYK